MSQLRIQAIGVILTENAILAGLDSSQAENAAMFGQAVLREGLAESAFEAILRGNAFIDDMATQNNVGYAKTAHYRRINDRDLPARIVPEGMMQ